MSDSNVGNYVGGNGVQMQMEKNARDAAEQARELQRRRAIRGAADHLQATLNGLRKQSQEIGSQISEFEKVCGLDLLELQKDAAAELDRLSAAKTKLATLRGLTKV